VISGGSVVPALSSNTVEKKRDGKMDASCRNLRYARRKGKTLLDLHALTVTSGLARINNAISAHPNLTAATSSRAVPSLGLVTSLACSGRSGSNPTGMRLQTLSELHAPVAMFALANT
jgi:hypothetical protein